MSKTHLSVWFPSVKSRNATSDLSSWIWSTTLPKIVALVTWEAESHNFVRLDFGVLEPQNSVCFQWNFPFLVTKYWTISYLSGSNKFEVMLVEGIDFVISNKALKSENQRHQTKQELLKPSKKWDDWREYPKS